MILEMTVDELQERWSYLYYELGIECLMITEKLKNGIVKKYVVTGLSMEIENDIVICIDNNDTILLQQSLLTGFLVKNLISIKVIPLKQEVLEFSDNSIVLIEAA